MSFGVVRVLGPKVAGEVEVATFRSDGAYLDGRRPESVTFGTAEADARRRDFTINGMFLDPIQDEVIDYVGGRADLDRRVIRAIGDPRDRFAEDKLRLLRAVRFAARLGFALDAGTDAAIRAMSAQVRHVAVERIAQELRKMLVDPNRLAAMSMAMDAGLIAEILPDLAEMPSERWERTLRILDQLPRDPSFPLATAALLSGLGDDEGSRRRAAEAIALELKLSNAERERIAWLVGTRDALERAEGMTKARLKRLMATAGIDELLALDRAVALSTSGDDSRVEACERYLRDQPDGPIDPPPLLTGRDLIRHGYRPGPGFASLLEKVRDAQLEGAVRDADEALRWLATIDPRSP